jgi:hypothetical protein
VPYFEKLQFWFGDAGVSVFSDGKGFSGYIKKWEDMGNVVDTVFGGSTSQGYLNNFT